MTGLAFLAVSTALLGLPVTSAIADTPADLAPKPRPATYDVGKKGEVPVTMSDGTVLQADIYYPANPGSSEQAPGSFPVIMVQTPYGKDTAGSASGQEGDNEASLQAGPIPYMVKRGYIDVVVDIRGQGTSQGTFGIFDPIQQTDGATLVNWASQLPGSNGKVGLYGPSYMGINEFLTANALPKGSPLKAMFPSVPGSDLYRDITYQGGLLDLEFSSVILGLFEGLATANPATHFADDPANTVKVSLDHAASLITFAATIALQTQANGDAAYDEDFWMARNPITMVKHVVDTGVPVYMVGGWFDLFQRGEPELYSGLQNALDGRSVYAPMKRDGKASGRYQLMQGPWYHLNAGTGVDVFRIELAWFDHWLRGTDNGIEKTKTPLHLFQLQTKRWVNTTTWPLTEADPHTFYFDGGPSGTGAPSINDGRLTESKPSAKDGSDQIAYTPATSPCTGQSDQWSGGGLALALQSGGGPPNLCSQDDRTLQTGPGALTYTTAPFDRQTVIGGPIDATIFATANRPDTAFIATLEDVAPSGQSTPLTSGALLGSFRAVDRDRSWFGDSPDHPLKPYHPYTRASVQPVDGGALTRYDVEVFPTYAGLAKGHSLRLTLTTSDTPHLSPSAEQAANLLGGVYDVQRRAGAASFLEVPIVGAGGGDRCANQITGTKRRNRLRGTGGSDLLRGLRGADRINGRGGDDCISGGRGRDRIKGGKGADRITGNGGRDRISGGAGRDRLLGGKGSDVIRSRDHKRDVVNCGKGRHDVAIADRRDRVRGCERIRRRP